MKLGDREQEVKSLRGQAVPLPYLPANVQQGRGRQEAKYDATCRFGKDGIWDK